MWSLLISIAVAGYGDAKDGVPSQAEREVHLWTNAVRLSPGDFKDDYGCWTDFEPDERKPKRPLALHPGLAKIARLHTEDMRDERQIDHTSSDGTPFETRVGPYYPSYTIGENVAQGQPTPLDVVLGWMCSSGHRSNIVAADFDELGVGAAAGQMGPYWTQDFGGRGVETRTLSMGVHAPEVPRGGQVTLYVDHWGDGKAPVAVVDGEAIPMNLKFGAADAGVYARALEVDDACHVYWFEADDGSRFPENGAYGIGPCDYADTTAAWLAPASIAGLSDDAPVGDGLGGAFPWLDPEDQLTGCDQSRGGSVLAGLLGLAALRRRQRRPLGVVA